MILANNERCRTLCLGRDVLHIFKTAKMSLTSYDRLRLMVKSPISSGCPNGDKVLLDK